MTLPPHNSRDTSIEAAESVADTVAAKRAIVFNMLSAQPTTCDAIEAHTGWPHQTVSARIWELHEAKRITDSTRRQTTRSGRNAIVWVVVDQHHPWTPAKRRQRPSNATLRAALQELHVLRHRPAVQTVALWLEALLGDPPTPSIICTCNNNGTCVWCLLEG